MVGMDELPTAWPGNVLSYREYKLGEARRRMVTDGRPDRGRFTDSGATV